MRLLALAVCVLSLAAVGQPLRLQFAANDAPTSVTIPIPESTRDFRKIAEVRFPFRSTSAIRWTVTFRNARGESSTFRVQPWENVRATAAIPVRFFTTEYMNNRPFTAFAMSNWSGHMDISDVREITISMAPNRPVTLDVGPFEFAVTATGDSADLTVPLVDEFGQWMAGDWPGKVHNLEELQSAWRAEDESLVSATSVVQRRKLLAPFRSTGFFRVEQAGGRWWFVDPEGQPFFSLGLDCIRTTDPTPVAGREKVFAKLPVGRDFYSANLALRYGAQNTFAPWRAKQEQRLAAWGFNTVANWSDPKLTERAAVPYVTNLSIGNRQGRWEGFPDAFSPEFAEAAAADARIQTGRYLRDSKLIGYFIGNEPHWQNRGPVDSVLRDPTPTETKKYVQSVLADRGESAATRDFLLEALSRKYFEVVCAAIRKADPNHLILGIRWAGTAPDPVLRANDVFDVFSINIYRFEPPRDQIAHIASVTKRPILIGEFHFGAPERGYAPSLVAVKDQAQRGAAYRYYVEHAAANPAIVGVHYFQFADQPVTGRFDGENYNIGFVNQLDIPYPELVEAARATHARVFDLHAGREVPIRVLPVVR